MLTPVFWELYEAASVWRGHWDLTVLYIYCLLAGTVCNREQYSGCNTAVFDKRNEITYMQYNHKLI